MSTTAPAKTIITEAQKQQFHEKGFFTLERCLPEEHLQLLRDNCQEFIDDTDAEMKKQGVDRLGLSALGKRYFVAYCYKKKPALGQFIFSELMADICRATIGDNVYLCWDQYVVKGPDKDSSFSWHQDSGYVHLDCPMCLTCWVTLDDITLDNGTVYLLPYDEIGIRTVVKHVKDPRVNDLVGYFGKNPGVPVILPAGSIAVFSSYCFHRSGPNLTSKLRRVYLPQYSATIVLDQQGKQFGQSVPFIKEGRIVWTPGMQDEK